MGCFPGTCFLSSLPIEKNDRVVIIPVHRSYYGDEGRSASSTCSFFEPLMLPFRAKYNEYGSTDKVDHPEVIRKAMFSVFTKHDAEHLDDEFDFEVTPRGLLVLGRKNWDRKTSVNFSDVKNKEVKNIDGVIKLISNGELRMRVVTEKENKELKTSLIMMHESLYDTAVASMRDPKNHANTKKLFQKMRGIKDWSGIHEVINDEKTHSLVNQGMSLFIMGMTQMGEIGTTLRMSKDLIVARPDIMFPIVDDYLDFLGFMFMTRRMFTPTAYGPQDMYLTHYKKLAAAAEKILYSKKETNYDE